LQVSAEIADSLEKYRLSSRPTFMLFKVRAAARVLTSLPHTRLPLRFR
jgi:hypothetical protein